MFFQQTTDKMMSLRFNIKAVHSYIVTWKTHFWTGQWLEKLLKYLILFIGPNQWLFSMDIQKFGLLVDIDPTSRGSRARKGRQVMISLKGCISRSTKLVNYMLFMSMLI